MKHETSPLLKGSLILLTMAFTFGCVPYVRSYDHVCLEESSNLKITRFSEISPASDGKPLQAPKVGLPIEARIDRPNYQLIIHVPLNPNPVVFLDGTASNGGELRLSGPNLIKMQNNYQYSFLAEKAKGAPISIFIRDSNGNLLGTENVSYRLRSRGYEYGVDAI